MNHELLTYEQASEALKPMKVSHHTLRRHASSAVPFKRRLRVVRFGHRTVGIRPADLEIWKARCAGENV